MDPKNNELLLPGLFDLSQDMVEYVPHDLIDDWLKSERTPELARTLLERNKVSGTLISTDTAGLSKISKTKDLFEVMAMISKPKEFIYSYGKAIGGRPVGIWAADNTQMFYPEEVPIRDIINMIYYVNRKILQTCDVKVGFGIHHGSFYDIGNGFYGAEADKLEHHAEDHVDGGNIAVSAETIAKLNEGDFNFTSDQNSESMKFHLLSKSNLPEPDVNSHDYKYPAPYSRAFHEDIRKLYDEYDASLLAEFRSKYVQNKIVVLIERERVTDATHEEELLDDLALYGVMGKTAVKLLIDYEGKRIKTVGNLGIYIFSDPAEALEFTHAYQIELQTYNVRSKAAIAKGEVLIFNLEQRHRDIAGNPVNIASKIAQNLGEFEFLYLTEDMFESLKYHELARDCKCSEKEVSNISLKYYHRKV